MLHWCSYQPCRDGNKTRQIKPVLLPDCSAVSKRRRHSSTGNDDDLWGRHKAFAPGHAKIIQDAWDNLSEAPVWTAFERQFAKRAL